MKTTPAALPYRKVALLALLLGCGRAAPQAEAPESSPEPSSAPGQATPTSLQDTDAERWPATLAEAEALLDKARADLDRLALNESGSAPPAATGAAAPSPVTQAPARSSDDSRDEKKDRRADKAAAADEAEASPAKEVSTCQTACKAFASLERASDAVCRLDAEGGQRCQRARQIREDAGRRVASCGCTK